MNQRDLKILQTNIDDMPGEQLPRVIDLLLEAGARDAWLTNITMKKGRPAYRLSVLSNPDDVEVLSKLILTHTTSLGVVCTDTLRFELERETRVVKTEFGEIRVKVAFTDGSKEVLKSKPEYDDCVRASEEFGVALSKVYEAVVRATSKTA